MYSNLDNNFLTESINSMPVAPNIVASITKIAMFTRTGGSLPLNEENLTIVESNRTMVEKIKMKISEVFLVRPKVANATTLSLTL